MHGFSGFLGLDNSSIDKVAFKKSINLASTMHIDSVEEKNFFSAVSFLDSAPIKGSRIYKNADMIYMFAGDLVGYNEVPWKDVEKNINDLNYKWFSTLRGLFAFVIYEKQSQQITLISDHRAQLPVYYSIIDGDIVFSTDLSTFTTLKNLPEFNEEWLYEYVFFNFPVDKTTFLKGVKRLMPITVLKIDKETLEVKEFQYGEYFKKAKHIITGKEAIDVNIKTFKERIPKYYSKDKTTLAAISGGFDSRTLLSLAPEGAKVETYTYGVKDSGDLNVVSTFINKLKIKHKEILFDKEFKRSLPTLIYDTVRLSGGVQSILRSTLPHVYKTLYKNDSQNIETLMGGINGDFFRGWGFPNGLPILSSGMKNYFQSGDIKIEKELYLKMFKSSFDQYENYIGNVLKRIKDKFGTINNPEAKMFYSLYCIDPNYFIGEMAIASNYFTFRQPFWDVDLLNLAFKTDCGHIGYFKRSKENKDLKYKQFMLQSKVISSNPKFKNTYIKGLPITLLASGRVLFIKVSRLFIRGFDHLAGHRKPKNNMEEWDKWLNDSLKDEMDILLNENSLILKYIDRDFMNSVKKKEDIQLLSKLVTTEIILNLIKNRWGLFK